MRQGKYPHHQKPIPQLVRLEINRENHHISAHFHGFMDPDHLQEAEETLMRAVQKCSSMTFVFEKDCMASSALIGVIVRVEKKLAELKKPLDVQVHSNRVLTLFQSLKLQNFLKLI